MGLMKISTYHKILGDEVRFVKGFDSEVDKEVWDRIYVTTLFTFDFDVDVETINHYKLLVNNINDLYVGGIMASLMPDKIVAATGIERSHILTGLFTDTSVVGDNYFAYTTRSRPSMKNMVRSNTFYFWITMC